jgi:hypothetical protein
VGVAPPRRGDLPGPPIRADPAGRLALQPAKFPLRDLQVPRVGDHLSNGRGEGDAACAASLADPPSLAFQVGALLGAGRPAGRHRRADGTGW